MKNLFINYSVNTGLSINAYRGANGYANSDVSGLVEDIIADRNGNCPVDGALEMLESDEWSGTNATPELLDELAMLIKNYAAE